MHLLTDEERTVQAAIRQVAQQEIQGMVIARHLLSNLPERRHQ